MKALENADSLFGFRPRLLIALGFSHQNAVASAMIALAYHCEGIAYCPGGDDVCPGDSQTRATRHH